MAESQIITAWGANFLKGNWRYVRQTFSGMGQDSFTQAPAQQEDMGSSLLNLLPPMDGGFTPRWGYSLFSASIATANSSSQSQPFFLYQNDTQDFRKFVLPQPGQVPAFGEDASAYVASLFTPAAQPRMVNSRSYGYFCSGNPLDLKKWAGDAPATITNWGILAPTSDSGTNDAASLVDAGGPLPWTISGMTAQQELDGAVGTGYLLVTDFGFSIGSTAPVSGLEVLFNIQATQPGGIVFIWLLQDGSTIGVPKGYLITDTALHTVTLGSSSDLWGASLTPSALNDSAFGFAVAVSQGDQSLTDYAFTNFQITAFAPEAMSLNTSGSGDINLVSGRIYYCVYQNGATNHCSDLSLPTSSTGPLVAAEVVLSGIPTSPDPQVTSVLILATADGGNEQQLYFVGSVANGTASYTDNTPDSTLVLQNLYLESDATGDETGVTGNTPPPSDLRFPLKHRGRLYGVSGIKNLFYSKADSELFTSTGLLVGKFEECWPALNFLDISEGAEEVLGLLSDGQVLYIGTERRIIRLFGDGPATYLQPEALFVGVGILNQDVWQIVFLEGNPVGAMWLTHDYRVVGSDFNTYQDVGTPVQDVLNSINQSAGQAACWAAFLEQGQYCLWMLAVPTGSNTQPDTLLVFDLKLRQWYVWKLADQALGAVLNISFSTNAIQNLINTAAGPLYLFAPGENQDRVGLAPESFPVQLQTSWTPLGDPVARKYLNELEVMTGDLATLVTVEGASTRADFLSPHPVVTNAPLRRKPLGEYFVSLAGKRTMDRYYRLTFNSSSATFDWLRGYNLEGVVLNRV